MNLGDRVHKHQEEMVNTLLGYPISIRENPFPVSGVLTFGKVQGLMDEMRYGVKFYEIPTMVIQFRVPKTKRKRVRKKWANDPKNFKPNPSLYTSVINGDIMGHPATIAGLKREIERGQHEHR